MTTIAIENERVDITDPCYDRGTWCAKWGVKVKNGVYDVSTNVNEDGRNTYIEMMLKGERAVKEQDIGLAGVDAGLCGFFVDKPDYKDDEWYKVCDEIAEIEDSGECLFEVCSGVCCSSGWGDGEYPIRAYYNKDLEIIGLRITFIEEE